MAIKLKKLKDQVIVITGASSGIGLCTAQTAARAGAKVVLAARSEDTLDDAVRIINENGGEAISVVCDVSDRAQVDNLAAQAIARFGRIDTWVNDAGLAIYGRLDEVSDEDSRRLFDVNFWGVVNGSLAALPHLKAQGGALINVGSEVSEAVAPMLGMYSASKHAVKGFTDGLRVEIEHVDKAPVSITLIQPTAVDTPFDEHGRNYMDQAANLPTPMIDPQDVADAILKAAVKPKRAIKVGTMSKVNTFVSTNLPGVGDRMSAGQVKNLQRDEPNRDPAGTLHTPSEDGRVRGDHPDA
ncbi:MAG: SDR family oxidoreductase [Planctomycetota bacterium]|nr:SDR family oxidoreductase [Planctomycetota bacterium]